jgi:hypothetical protein
MIGKKLLGVIAVLSGAVVLAVAGRAPAAAPPAPAFKSVLIKDVPHVRQKPDFCGEACAEMFLKKLGSKIDQDEVFDRSGVAPAYGRGCYTAELKRALESLGFRPGATWYQVEAAAAERGIADHWKALHADLEAGVPSIVCTHYSDAPKTTEHFRLVLGYDAAKDEVVYHEPAEDAGAYRRMGRAAFLKLWPLKYNDRTWTLVRLRLEPGKLAESLGVAEPTDADYAQQVMTVKQRLEEKLPGQTFRFVVQKPFVVIGDEEPDTVRARAARTVKWAHDMLTAEYFPKPPDGIHEVWLFKDKDSYEAGAKKLFGQTPHTPYGYYAAESRALVMNIATGGGTLVHEMVHAYVRANFPGCPAWLNEGLGSLYEQCGESGGRICGYTNWRLAGLQKAVREKRVPEFSELCGTTTEEFYGKDKGTNYAQARYLCYYLQEKGLLRKFYGEFFKNRGTDPTGYETLKKTLGLKDEKAAGEFKKSWEEFVLGLKFR